MSTLALPACSCGEPHPHRVASRKTADGFDAVLWSDGWLTSRMGFQVAKLPVDGMWAAIADVCLLDWTELRPFALAWKRARRRARATARAAALAAIWPQD